MSSWSFKVGTLAGITVRVHGTMVLLLAWLFIEHLRQGGGAAALEGLALMVCTFAFVTFHELGHALTARRYGIRTRDITLWPIGGVATFERLPERPRDEIAVALAGPFVNVLFGAFFFFVLVAAQLVVDVQALRVAGGPFVAKLMVVNLSLAAFNLLPAFPMDGGRVLRALLSTRRSRVDATRLAMRVGQALALAMAAAGVVWSPMLLLIAAFVFLAGQQELAQVQLERLTVADAMVSRFQALDADTPVSEALELSRQGFQHDFPVKSGGGLVGLLSREELLEAANSDGDNSPVGGALHGPLTSVESSTPLLDAAKLMGARQTNAAVVLDHGRLVGMVTREDIASRLMAGVRS